jgi:type IX secretion system PorP/SprF family membrane protein
MMNSSQPEEEAELISSSWLMRYIHVSLLLFTFFFFRTSDQTVHAQQPYSFNLYMFNPMVINPGYTGSNDVFTIISQGKTQWTGIDGAPEAINLTAATPLRRSNAAMGAFINTERFGVTNRTGFYYNYAYRIKLRKRSGGLGNKGRGEGFGVLSMGLSGGFDLRNSRWSEVQSSDPFQQDPEFAFDSGVLFEPNFGFGLFFHNDKYYGGVSVPRFLRYTDNPLEQKTSLSLRIPELAYYFHGGMLFLLSNEFKLRPQFLVKWIPNGSFQLDLNANLIYLDMYTFGITYRTAKTISALLRVYVNRQFSVGYAYDYSFNDLSGFSGGSHELVIQYEFGFNVRTTNPRYF